MNQTPHHDLGADLAAAELILGGEVGATALPQLRELAARALAAAREPAIADILRRLTARLDSWTDQPGADEVDVARSLIADARRLTRRTPLFGASSPPGSRSVVPAPAGEHTGVARRSASGAEAADRRAEAEAVLEALDDAAFLATTPTIAPEDVLPDDADGD